MTASGARQHLTALVEAGLVDATELPTTTPRRGRRTLVYVRDRRRRRLLPEGVRRADQRAPRLSRRHRSRAAGRPVREAAGAPDRSGPGPPRRQADARHPGGGAHEDPRRGRLPRHFRADRGGRLPHRRAQLRDLGCRPALRPGLHERDRLHPRGPPRCDGRARATHGRRQRATAPTRSAPPDRPSTGASATGRSIDPARGVEVRLEDVGRRAHRPGRASARGSCRRRARCTPATSC